MNWAGSAFVANQGSVAIGAIPAWITRLFVQVAWGATPTPLDPARLAELRQRFDLGAWAWCQGEDVEAEAHVHRQAAQGYSAFVANCEEPYDAHGNQADPRFHMPAQYLAALAWDGPLGITTTPLFASDTTTWRQAGAVYMPQAFPLENGAEVDDAVEHGKKWGWATERQRPLVQCYTTNGQRPSGAIMDTQATELGVGIVPYVIEQATDDGGQQWLALTQRSVERPTAEPEPEEPMDWWTIPYPRADAPAYSGKMPRPLYPPDAAAKGKRPSMDGEDVKAVKWAVKMAQRWAKDKTRDQLDDSFSNGFAHGTGGNVAVTGLAGFQRQQGIDDTGWMGQKTFDALNWALCPAGPNAGKPLFDATAVGQLERAWDRFQGKEPPPPPDDPRQLALDHLKRRVGYTEQPDGSNCDNRADGIRTAQDHTAGGGTWLRYEPWCGCWCYYALEAAGVERIDSHLASVAQIEDFARAGEKCYRGWTTDRSKVKPGDLVVVGGYGTHVETVRAKPAADGSVPTYGGNTSPGTSGSQSNGGGAYERVRYPDEVRGFALVRYPGE